MRFSLGQELRQVQKQILAPRMIQSMEILQLPLQRLEERIQQEMVENPFLELRADSPDADEESDSDQQEEPRVEVRSDLEKELVIDESSSEEFERLETLTEENPEVFDDEMSRPSSNRMEELSDRYNDMMANVPSHEPTLQDHLIEQLAGLDISPEVRAMAEMLIYSLDSDGYLKTDIRDLLGPDAAQEDEKIAEQALAVVQQMDPAGVGARTLKECLLLQLDADRPHHKELATLIREHLEDVGENRIPQIAKKRGWTVDFVEELIAELRTLNPKPGAQFGGSSVPNVVPDVYVEETEDGRFVVQLKDDHLSRLGINEEYRRLVESRRSAKQDREFFRRKLTHAQWLIEAVQQRRNTLRKVAQAIVDHQQRFLRDGPEYIEPLKMQQIADEVGVHVTTVSRAVDDKWIETPRGIFPLKRFFRSGTVGQDGQEIAWDKVRSMLQEIVAAEDKQNPLTDEDLVAELARRGVNVNRRTITKYRQELGIPSSRQRKDWRQAAK